MIPALILITLRAKHSSNDGDDPKKQMSTTNTTKRQSAKAIYVAINAITTIEFQSGVAVQNVRTIQAMLVTKYCQNRPQSSGSCFAEVKTLCTCINAWSTGNDVSFYLLCRCVIVSV